MTVKDLMKILEGYSPYMNVKVALHKQIGDLKEHTVGIDMETNIESVWLCGDRESKP